MFGINQEHLITVRIGQVYNALNTREQRLIIVVCIMLLISSCYYLVYLPVDSFQKYALTRFQTERNKLQWMKTHETDARAERNKNTSRQNAGESTLTLIATTANEFNVRVTRYRPDPDGIGVTFVIQRQPFNNVLQLTERLSSQYNFEITHASLNSHGDSGLVSARFNIR